jgi:hypothetical protein
VPVATGAPEQSLVVYRRIVLPNSPLPRIIGVGLAAGEFGDTKETRGGSMVVVSTTPSRLTGAAARGINTNAVTMAAVSAMRAAVDGECIR